MQFAERAFALIWHLFVSCTSWSLRRHAPQDTVSFVVVVVVVVVVKHLLISEIVVVKHFSNPFQEIRVAFYFEWGWGGYSCSSRCHF